MKTLLIPSHKVAKLEKKIAKLNKKADKYGVGHISYTIGEKEYHSREQTIRHDRGVFTRKKVQYAYNPVHLDYSEVVKLDGFTVCAMLEKLDGNNNMVTIFAHEDELDVAKLQSVGDFYCGHCKTARVKKYLAVVRNNESGELLFVGKSCLQDFIGHDISCVISMMDYTGFVNLAYDEDDEDMSDWPAYLMKEYLIACCITCMRDYGYRYDQELASNIHQMYFDPKLRPDSGEDIDKLYERFSDYCTTLKGTANSFQSNLYSVMESSYVPEKCVNIVIAGFVNWFNAEKRKERVAEENKTNEFFGTVGKREIFELTATELRFFNSDYGKGYIVKGVQTGTDNSFTWFTTNPKDFVEFTEHGDCKVIEESFAVKATVKEHKVDERYGNSTIITRVNM